MKEGDRIRITGGYDDDSPLRRGSGELRGTVITFVSGYEAASPAAVVRLDTPLTIDGLTSEILVMELRYESASWARGEPGTQTVGLALCSEMPSAAAPGTGHGTPFETHAIFEVI